MKDYSILTAPLVALMVGRIACRVIRRIAPTIGFVDNPDRRRKFQEVPIPLGGGLAVWIATWIGIGIGQLTRPQSQIYGSGEIALSLTLAIASLSILILGLVDDRFGMRGLHKLAGQLITAAIMVGMGLRIEVISGFGIQVDLGILSYPFTMLWIVLVINAFNLIDGMDGFCSGIGLVALLTIAPLAFWNGNSDVALISLALAGSLAAFVRDNLPPAKIYLGDAGSMTVGVFISALSIRACSTDRGNVVSLPLLVALLSLPLLDVATALLRRWLTGHSLFMPDRGHIHHCLRTKLRSTGRALGIGVGLAAVVASGAAMAKSWQLGDAVAGLLIVALIVVLVGTNLFGGSESRLLIYRLKMLIQSLRSNTSGDPGIIKQDCHMIGFRDWSKVWDGLIRSVEEAGGRRIELAIDLPTVGETYHGIWNVPVEAECRSNWSIVHTLEIRGQHAGTVRIVGEINEFREGYLDQVEKIVRELQFQVGEELQRHMDGRDDFQAPSPSQFPMTQRPGHGMARLVIQNSEA